MHFIQIQVNNVLYYKTYMVQIHSVTDVLSTKQHAQ